MKLTQYMCLGNILSHVKRQGHRSKGQRSPVNFIVKFSKNSQKWHFSALMSKSVNFLIV